MPAPRFDHLTTREQFIAAAAAHSITLLPHDFSEREPVGLCIDGVPAAEWLDAMAMD